MLLAFSAVINFNLKQSSQKHRYSYTVFDAPNMYKTAEANIFCLMEVFCRCMDRVRWKVSNGLSFLEE